MKVKRSERLVEMTALLLNHPYKLFSLTDFTEKYQVAKSSISEDLSMLKEMFESQDLGVLTTYSGVTGGVKFAPSISQDKQLRYADELIEKMNDYDRVLPGGYLYITDLLGDPVQMKHAGLILASQHVNEEVDVILTVATKGISLAQSLGQYLNVPVVVARKDSKVTEGATVSVKYTSQSSPHVVQSMEVVRESIEANSRLILVDDFLRGGGTMTGMQALVDIFDSQVLAQYVLCQHVDPDNQYHSDIKSIMDVQGLGGGPESFQIKRGSLFEGE